MFADKEQISIDQKFIEMAKRKPPTGPQGINRLEEDQMRKHQQLSRFGVGAAMTQRSNQIEDDHRLKMKQFNRNQVRKTRPRLTAL